MKTLEEFFKQTTGLPSTSEERQRISGFFAIYSNWILSGEAGQPPAADTKDREVDQVGSDECNDTGDIGLPDAGTLRLTALALAHNAGGEPDRVIDRARAYADFLSGAEKQDAAPEPSSTGTVATKCWPPAPTEVISIALETKCGPLEPIDVISSKTRERARDIILRLQPRSDGVLGPFLRDIAGLE